MKLKLREKELPPVQLRLVVPAGLKGMLDRYVGFVQEGSGREVEARQIAVEILAQFMESDRQFKQWQRRDQKPSVPAKRARISESGPSQRGGVSLSRAGGTELEMAWS